MFKVVSNLLKGSSDPVREALIEGPQQGEISEEVSLDFIKTIIPLALMASESIAHSAFSLMGY